MFKEKCCAYRVFVFLSLQSVDVFFFYSTVIQYPLLQYTSTLFQTPVFLKLNNLCALGIFSFILKYRFFKIILKLLFILFFFLLYNVCNGYIPKCTAHKKLLGLFVMFSCSKYFNFETL